MPKTKNHTFAMYVIIALVTSQILWGVNKPIIKLGLETIPLSLFLSVTIVGTALLILPFALKDWKRLVAKDYALLAIGSVISITIGNVALLLGLQRVPTINASLISMFGPLILFYFSVQFLKEKLSARALIGVLIAFIGAIILIGKPWDIQAGNSTLALGNLLLIIYLICDVTGTLVTKTVLKRGGLYQITFLHLVMGIAPVAVFSIQHLDALLPQYATTTGYVTMALNIIVITFANCLFMYGLKYKQAQEIGVFSYISPLTTMITAWLLLGEKVGLATGIGALLICSGVYLTVNKQARKLNRKPLARKSKKAKYSD